jgi:hypothetical protein
VASIVRLIDFNIVGILLGFVLILLIGQVGCIATLVSNLEEVKGVKNGSKYKG